MEINVERRWRKEKYTIGKLYINGEYICNTLEDTDRGLTADMPLSMIKSKKIPSETAIPVGRYEVTLNVVSNRFVKKFFYRDFCEGRLPRLLEVPGFDGILLHAGSTEAHTAGCILVGHNTIKGRLTSSQETFKTIYAKMMAAHNNSERIFITIE